jgi:hypothetical protein
VTGMAGGVQIRLTGNRADVEALADALTRHGQLLGLVVVQASGWYPNRPRRLPVGQHPGSQPADVDQACAGRVYLHTHPSAVP